MEQTASAVGMGLASDAPKVCDEKEDDDPGRTNVDPLWLYLCTCPCMSVSARASPTATPR